MNFKLNLINALILLAFISCKQKTEEKQEISEYTVTSPIVRDTTFTKEYVAQIQSIQNVEIRSQEKGFLESLKIDEGQQVKEGQLLFTIMPKVYEAEFMKAKANATEAELELQNIKTLSEKNIVSKTELLIQQAKLDEAKADLALAETHLSFTKIYAPFDGTIDRIKFKKGSLIDEGTILTTISNNKEIYAYFNASETEYLDYKTRPKNDNRNIVKLLLSNGTEHKYTGVIETIESEFDNSTGNIAFRAKFPNPELLLKHGETGKVLMLSPLKNALIIPQKATFEMQDKVLVYVVENDIVKSRIIKVKQKLDNLYIIESGLTSDDKILLDGIQSVKENDHIKVNFVRPEEIIYNLQLISSK